MIEKSMEIKLPKGLDARPVAVLVQVASKHDCSIYLEAEGKKVNAKSIMGMMSLVLDKGEKVVIIADGTDEAEAVAEIEEYLEKGETKVS